MRKFRVGDIVTAKKRVGEVRQLLDNGRAFVYFPYVHETDQMVLSGYEQHWNMSDLRAATASEKKDFKRRKKELESGGGGMNRRRYELIDPSVNARKFWEIEVNGSEVTTFWGRIGSAPASKSKDFKTAAKADAEVKRLVKEKEKKGYELVSGKFKVQPKKAVLPKRASRNKDWELWVYIKAGVSPADAKKVTKTLSRFESLDWMGDGSDSEEFDVSFFGERDVVEKAAAAVDTLKIKGVRTNTHPSAGDEPMTKKSKKYHGGQNGTAKAPKKPKRSAGKLTSSEVNWLAKHGWSSAQIAALTPAEARRLIAVGKHKKPGADTEMAAALVDNARLKAYRDDLIKAGVGFKIPSTLDVVDLAKSITHISAGRRDITDFVKFAVTHGVFTDGDRCLLVVPQSVAKDVKNVLQMARPAK